MNRRTFFTTTAACVATGGLGVTRKLYAQSTPNINAYLNSGAAHSITLGNAFYSCPNGADFVSAGNSLQPVLDDWQANNIDSLLNYSQVTPDMITTNNLNLDATLQQIQIFQPAFQMSDLLDSLSVIGGLNTSQIGSVISNLQQYGMSGYLQTIISQAPNLASNVDAVFAPVSWHHKSKQPHKMRAYYQHKSLIPSPEIVKPHLMRTYQDQAFPQSGGYNCQWDDLAILFAGTAFLILAVMSGGIIPGLVVLSAPFWLPLATWGGAAVGVWTLGHGIFC